MADINLDTQDVFFESSALPKMAEHFFFLFFNKDATANCITVHRYARPGLALQGKSEVFTWAHPAPYVFKGVVLTRYLKNCFEAVGDVSIKFCKIGNWYQAKGDKATVDAGYKREGQFDYIINPGNEQKSFKINGPNLVKIYDNGIKILNRIGFGNLYDMSGTYKNSDNGEEGKFYISKLGMNTLKLESMFLNAYHIYFDDGSMFRFLDSPAFQNLKGIYINRKNNTYLMFPNASFSKSESVRSIKCWDDKGNTIEATGEMGPSYLTDFKRGPFELGYNQVVGKLKQFSVNNEVVDKPGIVYCEETRL